MELVDEDVPDDLASDGMSLSRNGLRINRPGRGSAFGDARAPASTKSAWRVTARTIHNALVRRYAVLVADDHAILTEGLVSLLKEHDFEVVGSVSDGDQLIEAARRLRPDVIVTDISMPGLSGLDVLARLKVDRLGSRVIVLTMHHDVGLAVRAVRAGAAGYLLKDSAGAELVNAIHQVLQGRVYLTPAITREVMERMAAPEDPREQPLTPRQLDVLRLILKGKRMKEIAAELSLSVRTVETHKYELMETLDIHSTAELVRYAMEHRLIVD
jgi:DNA-binding NarL/FixJ family response regulator